MLKYGSFEMCPYGILGKMCCHRAVKCATKLLSRRRKVGSLMKLNIVNCYGSYPMHPFLCLLVWSSYFLTMEPIFMFGPLLISPLEYAVERLRYVHKIYVLVVCYYFSCFTSHPSYAAVTET